VEVKRGDIVLASGAGDFSRKPRPFLVVQSDAFNPVHRSVSMCPVTSVLAGEGWVRVALEPTPETGLERESEAEIDKVSTLRRERIVKTIGSAPSAAMLRVDVALRRWLDL
jgi:mRNA interferase MazF